MPNIRQLKKRENKTRKWAKEAMEQAMQEVQDGRLTRGQAAKKFGVPKTTLIDRLSGRVATYAVPGQKQLLVTEDESALVEYCLYSASQGLPLTKPQVVTHALAIYNYRNPDTPKTSLGQTWWINFRERHHERLATQTIDFTDQGKDSCMKTGQTEDFFRFLTATLEENGMGENPCQIYNCAKTGFQLYSGRKKVPQVTKQFHRQTKRGKDHITVLVCFNAAGEDVPPFIIYKEDYPGGHYKKEGVPNALYGTSHTGDLDGELFRKWFKEHFLKFAVQERPLLLFMDEHQPQMYPELVEEAQREGIILLLLPPHTSHILQPLDVSFFGPLKADFSDFMQDLSSDITSFSVSRKEFSKVLRDSYQGLKDQRVVVDGFRRCGLYPLNPGAITSSQVILSELQLDDPAPAPSTPLASCALSDVIQPSHLRLSPVVPPKNPLAASPYSPYLTHPLVASGHIPVDLAHLLIKTSQTCNRGIVRRKAHVLTAQKMSNVIKREEDPAAGIEAQTTPTSSPTSSFSPPIVRVAKRQKREKNILRCGRCRQSYPPHDPEGLVLWVQCDNCHKLFHTICVSSEMDLDEVEFWCYWCLDV